MPTFTASTPAAISAAVASEVPTLPAIDLDVGEARRQLLDRVEHALAVAVGGVDHEHVDLGLDQRRGALERVGAVPDRGAARAAGRASPCRRSGT